MKKNIFIALFLGLLVWCAILWPHPKVFNKAIPQFERIAKDAPVIADMTPGDQIQLLYHFWLCGDMIKGKTPLFSNIYEYNIDGDENKFRFDPYYIPFSLIYAAIASFSNDATGWNCAIIFSHLTALLGFFLLSRRFTNSNFTATVVSVTASSFPYRWIALINGSPTGFAICLVPWIFYGIDRVIRDSSYKGSFIAGLALFFAYCSDLHVFYFSCLSAPLAVLISYTNSPVISKSEIKSRIFSFIPLAVLALAAVTISMLSTKLGNTSMAGGRTLSELAILAPIASGIIRHQPLQGTSNHIFIGIAMVSVLFLSYIAFLFSVRPIKSDFKRIILVTLLTLTALGIYSLALGTNGPLNGLPIKTARALLPKYTMIRQTVKIFCIYPAIIVILMTIILSTIQSRMSKSKSIFFIATAILSLAVIAERSLWFRPQFSRLPENVPAFEAVVQEADKEDPKAVCATLWPGDSHYSSLYEYGIMHSRLRLINGYSPAVPANYMDEIFKPLSSINEGHLSDDQITRLLNMGVEYVIFYESPYLKKVAPFSGGVALQNLANNPKLRLINQSGVISAFKISAEKEAVNQIGGNNESQTSYLDYPSAFHWNQYKVQRSIDTGTNGMINLTLRAPVTLVDNMRYMLLDKELGWFSLPMTNSIGNMCELPPEAKNIEYILISAGTYPVNFSTPVSISPARLFHTGISNIKDQSVFFSKETTPAGVAMHGPALPIPKGDYILTITTTGNTGKTSLELYTHNGNDKVSYLTTPLSAVQTDKTAVISFTHNNDYPFYLELLYHADSDFTVNTITIRSQK